MTGKVEEVRIDDIEFAEDNPNVEDPETFNLLVESIKEYGMIEFPVLTKRDDKYIVVAGEHRIRAARQLGYDKVPAVIIDVDEINRKIYMVRSNVLRGKIDRTKLAYLIGELRTLYNRDMLKKKLGFTEKDKTFDKIFESVVRKVPKEVAKELRKMKDKIQTTEELIKVVNELMEKYKKEVENSKFIVFSQKGKESIIIRANSKVYKLALKVTELARQYNEDINVMLEPILKEFIDNYGEGGN